MAQDESKSQHAPDDAASEIGLLFHLIVLKALDCWEPLPGENADRVSPELGVTFAATNPSIPTEGLIWLSCENQHWSLFIAPALDRPLVGTIVICEATTDYDRVLQLVAEALKEVAQRADVHEIDRAFIALAAAQTFALVDQFELSDECHSLRSELLNRL